MTTPLAYEDLAEAIARHVYDNWYCEEAMRINQPPVRVFDNRCGSYLQIPGGVLKKLKIIEPIDKYEQVFVFICEPPDFRQRAIDNKAEGCGFDTVVLAIVVLMEYFELKHVRPLQAELVQCLVRLGLCDSPVFETKAELLDCLEELGSEQYVYDWRRTPDIKLKWTDKKAYYDALRRDWPALIK